MEVMDRLVLHRPDCRYHCHLLASGFFGRITVFHPLSRCHVVLLHHCKLVLVDPSCIRADKCVQWDIIDVSMFSPVRRD